MCFVQELICCHTLLINIFGKSYENNYCKTALNRIFVVEISQIRVLNRKKSLIFELLDFAAFLYDLEPAPFLCKREQVKPARFSRPPGPTLVFFKHTKSNFLRNAEFRKLAVDAGFHKCGIPCSAVAKSCLMRNLTKKNI